MKIILKLLIMILLVLSQNYKLYGKENKDVRCKAHIHKNMPKETMWKAYKELYKLTISLRKELKETNKVLKSCNKLLKNVQQTASPALKDWKLCETKLAEERKKIAKLNTTIKLKDDEIEIYKKRIKRPRNYAGILIGYNVGVDINFTQTIPTTTFMHGPVLMGEYRHYFFRWLGIGLSGGLAGDQLLFGAYIRIPFYSN